MARRTKGQNGEGRKGASRPYIPPTDDRLDEIARILALGILRLRAKQDKTRIETADSEREFGVDFLPDQSVHAGE